MEINDILKIQAQLDEQCWLEPRRRAAKIFGFGDKEIASVTKKTLFFIHGYQKQAEETGELPDFVKLSPLVEKGKVFMMDEPQFKLDLALSR